MEITEKQQYAIRVIEEVTGTSFKGTTKEEARQYIKEHEAAYNQYKAYQKHAKAIDRKNYLEERYPDDGEGDEPYDNSESIYYDDSWYWMPH